MEYPLYIDGVERGRLRVEQQGLYTVLEAELPDVHEGLVRLWIWGGGEREYLGLMQPWSGGMYLRRKLSRREMERFPKNIEYAADEMGLHKNNNPEENMKKEEKENSASLHNEKELPTALSCPYPAREPGGELDWYQRPDGSLVAFDGQSSLVALPAKLRKAAPGAVLRRIGGGEYMVFRY